MRKRFIMTAFGKDRLGFIADVARVIYENGCSLEDSTMTNLSDEFAMIFLVEGEDTGLEMERGISAFVRPISEVSSTSKKDVKLHTLRVEGLDQAGIVYKISRYLADNGINITHFESKSTPSPQTGAPMYTIRLEFEVAPEADLGKIEEGLAEIGNELNVDITME